MKVITPNKVIAVAGAVFLAVGCTHVLAESAWEADRIAGTNASYNSYFLGKVGIETADPRSPLDVGRWSGMPGDASNVKASIAGDAFVGNVGGNVARLRMGANANSGFFSFNEYWTASGLRTINTNKTSWSVQLHGDGDYFRVGRAAATDGRPSYVNLLHLSGSGNLGIGTTDPQSPLDVGKWNGIPGDASNIKASIAGDTFIGNVGANVARLRMAANANSGILSFNEYWTAGGLRTINTNKTSWSLHLQGDGDYFGVCRAAATDGAPSYSTLLYVKGSDGSVGVGTESPSETLHVAGSGRFDGGITYVHPQGDLSMGSFTNAP